jgi:integrase
VLTAVEKGDSGRRKKRLAEDNRLSPATIAKRVSVAKQVFHAAVEWDWVVKNPFVKLRTGSQANPKRACYVPLATILDVLHACPSMEWKLIVALSRLAGLRCPSEIRGLTWDNINWEKGRLTVLARKMEHHGGDHAVRFVPLCPEPIILGATNYPGVDSTHSQRCTFRPPRAALFNRRSHPAAPRHTLQRQRLSLHARRPV